MGLWQEERWACCAIATPFDDKGAVDTTRLAAFARHQLASGMNGLAIFGTCGEGPCISASERIAATAKLIELGLPADRLILGIGSAVPEEMALLAREAGRMGLAATLATPPFYFREVPDEGIYRAFSSLVEAAGSDAPPMFVYHIPSVTGMPLSPALLERLAAAHPGRIVGVKDSGADIAFTRQLLDRLPGFTILVGAEVHILEAMANGGRGTICGLANVAPQLIARIVAGETAAMAELSELEQSFAGSPFIPKVKAILAAEMNDPAWRRVLAPLLPLEEPLARAA